MTRYCLEQLNEDQFETLVVDLCEYLLGVGVLSFTKGKDGGRDAYFVGTANHYPSEAAPWSGRFIIQAKHVASAEASCSDNSFFHNQSSVVKKEVERLKVKQQEGESFDNYLLFTNRKLTGGIHPVIREYILKELKLANADVVGVEYIERMLDDCPDLVRKYRLMRFVLPDRFYEKDIRDIIILFDKQTTWVDDAERELDNTFKYVDKEEKNRLNGVDDDYFSEIKHHSLMHFKEIESFLKNPVNFEYKRKYINTTADLRSYIRRNQQVHPFVDLLECIIEEIVSTESNEVLRNRALARVFVHYMYWNCDIGRKEEL